MISEKVRERLKEYQINEDAALLYLLGVYYNLNTKDHIPEEIIKQVNFSKIVTRDYDTEVPTVKWNIPLFEGEETESAWNWVLEWRDLFKAIRGDAGGDKKACIIKMKKFFAANPDVRQHEVFEAANLYLDDFRYRKTNLKFLQQADYFISKAVVEENKSVKRSRLEIYLELVRDKNKAAEQTGSEATRFMGGMS